MDMGTNIMYSYMEDYYTRLHLYDVALLQLASLLLSIMQKKSKALVFTVQKKNKALVLRVQKK